MAGNEELFYEVEKLLERRINAESGGIEYLVRWRGFTSEWDTWEPNENLHSCASKIKTFEKNRMKKRLATEHKAKKLIRKSKLVKAKKNVKANKNVLIKNNSPTTLKSLTPKQMVGGASLSLEDVFIAVLGTASSEGLTPESMKQASVPNSLHKRSLKVQHTMSEPKKLKLSSPKSNSSDTQNEKLETILSKKLEVLVQKSSPKTKSFGLSSGNKVESKPAIKSAFSAVVKADKNAKHSKTAGIDNGIETTVTNELEKKKVWQQVDDEISFSSEDDLKLSDLAHKTEQLKPAKELKNKSSVTFSKAPLSGKDHKKYMNNSVSEESPIAINHQTSSTKKTVKSQKQGLPKKTKKALEVAAESSDDDSDILYYLPEESGNCSQNINQSKSLTENEKKTEQNFNSDHCANVRKEKSQGFSSGNGRSKLTSPKKMKIRLLDSKMPPFSPETKGRPISPTPVYTTMKHTGDSGSQSLIARPQWLMPGDDGVTPTHDQQACLPISPASMSYKVLLENLPQQLHPKKNGKGGRLREASDAEDIERRVSIRTSECAFKFKEILIKKCQKYSQIWLHTHTKMRNALNPLVMQEIMAALSAAKYDDSTVVMLSGLGNVFCSGIDLHYLTTGDRKVAAKEMADSLRDLIRKFISFPKLIVAVVTGPAIGLGSAILPLCDIVYASDKASFYMPYAQLSQTPEGCASYTLPDTVGAAMANELLIDGRKITAIHCANFPSVTLGQ
ncbi:chromodomain Y-like protein isoform X2 [Dreissena polymorpha]|uniref:chromodomain Y-like protein isoform X2 n=1 Tax=Dreissena polymorpha TaxID=45954 RepID=UPI002264D3F6|nr:chromodomain Y-like protein isoform X2 [Dreissena polymorpha]